MQESFSLTGLTPDAFSSNELMTIFPEFYELRHVVESQSWHDNQTVFDHSIESARALETIMRFEYLTEQDKDLFTQYLDSVVDGHSRRELLRAATLFHDAGKLISLQQNSTGETSSPSHGVIGEWMAKPMIDRLDISQRAKQVVQGLVADHLIPSDLIELSLNNNTPVRDNLTLLLTHRPETAVELLLLGYADWLGCAVRDSAREERSKRIALVHEWLSIIAAARRGDL